MVRYFRYENIWFRNLFFLTLIFCTIILIDHFEGPSNEDRVAEISYAVYPNYLLILGSNLLLVNGLLHKNKYGDFIIFFLLYWMVMTILGFYIPNFYKPEHAGVTRVFRQFFIAIVGSGFYFIHLWITQNIITTSRKLAVTENELNFLKQQLNPHFLLNAMNNLYGESLARPESIPERILELSTLLRYQIEATKKESVSLISEMDFVKKYMEYYQYKSGKLTVINHAVIAPNQDRVIPPLVLMPLVENAVKFSSETDEPYIKMDWEITPQKFCFMIENSYLPEGSKLNGTNLGISNLMRRLEVLSIKYSIDCEQDNEHYKLKLQLWDLPTNA
ncbi:histidine kinase [Flavobacterium zepuense]|uniref:Histidine kinase n=1 Tax=Flavobacterium zepuense TaxID=2593302 RepID=A0A552V085_9FLAO|nr:histidine kinase [Flavobacterium zepuense]TRW23842.1 histidine kinase [Flavobacterium zepuense]